MNRSDRSDVVIVSDDDDLPAKMQKRSVSITKHQAHNAPVKSCPGYQLRFPPGQQAHMSYPFALHTQAILLLTWDYSGHRDGFFLVSHMCTGVVKRNGQCERCDDLENNEYLQRIVARFTNGLHKNMTLIYHGIGGLIDVVHRKMQTINILRLCCLNEFKKLVGKQGAINVHKQLLLAISSQRIPCVKVQGP